MENTRRISGVRPKHVFAVIFTVATLFVFWHWDRFIFNSQDPAWHHYGPIRWHIIPHGLAGVVALGLGALQFSNRLRQRYLRLHRLCGKIYIAGAFIAAPVAIWIAFIQGPPVLIPSAFIQSGAWMIYTAIAFMLIRRGNVTQHREWMMRGYAMPMVFVETRVFLAIPVIARMGVDGVIAVVWSCIAINLIAPELILRWRTLFPAKRLALQMEKHTVATAD